MNKWMALAVCAVAAAAVGIFAIPSGATREATAGLSAADRQAARGGSIAFTRRGSVYAVAANGTGLRKLATGSSRDSEHAFYAPSWSPAGYRIIYREGDRGSVIELWMSRADGSGARKLPIDAAYIFEVSWSPTGKNLAFSRLDFDTGNW